MRLQRTILRLLGWKVNITIPATNKCIICVAPHTSNWDFIMGILAYGAVGRRASFLMKSTWFFPPLGWIFRAMGGIPVYRNPKDKTQPNGLVEQLIKRFRTAKYLNLAVTPEGTRSANAQWRTGFLRIAYVAKVPIYIGILDYGTKTITISHEFTPTGNIELDLASIKKFYSPSQAKYPAKFAL